MTQKRSSPPLAPSGPPPEDETPPAAEASVEASELAALRDRHLRLAAEYDNYRKRIAKERTEAWARAQAELVAHLAEPLDDLARFAAIDREDSDAAALREGIALIERKLWKELAAAGVTRIDQTGVPFDPHVHEAVTTQPAAGPEQDHMVGQVLQAGYQLRDILLRPARVVVLTWQGE